MSIATLSKTDAAAAPRRTNHVQEWRFRDELEAPILERIRAIQPLLRQQAPLADQQRTMTEEVFRALDEIGVFHSALPVRLGGLGLSALSVGRISAEIAKGDPSAAWVVQIVNGTTWVTSLSSDEIQDVIYKDGPAKVCGAFNPPGTAVPVEGGFLVTGRWPYASGFRQASWGQWGIAVQNSDGTKTPGAFCYIPTREVTLEDTWFTTGLQGTGSDTGVVKDVFVPRHMVVFPDKSYNYVAPGKRNYGAPSDYFNQISFVHRTGAAQLVGMAEALLDLIQENAKNKGIVATMFSKQVESHVAVRDIGEAAIKIQTARMLVERACSELDAWALSKTTPAQLEKANNKACGSLAVQLLAETMDKLMFLGGSSAFQLNNPMSKYWRDFEVAARHIANIPNTGFEVFGREILGVTPNIVPSFMV